MQIRINGGRLIDPGHFDGIADLLVENGESTVKAEHLETIEKEAESQRDPASNTQHPEFQIIDASGKIVTPGLIDMHVHLREPGHEYKETIESDCRPRFR